MVISDLQIPFEHPKALQFCKYVKRHFKIKNENVLCVGDEIDAYYGGLWKKSIQASVTAQQELEQSIDTIRKWGKRFPEMKLAISNHGTRWQRKAFEAEILSQMIRRYEDVIDAPSGWKWKKEWIIKGSKKTFRMCHGDDWSGQHPGIQAVMHTGMSSIMGHFHSIAEINHIKTVGFNEWGMVVGSLIDAEQFAFEYQRKAKKKPVLGVGVILDGGMTPLFVPMD